MKKTLGFGLQALKNFLSGEKQPTDIYIMLTSRCNSRCIMCNEWKEKPFELPKKAWFSIIDDLVGFCGSFAKINFSGGEVLTMPSGLDIVQHCASKNFATGIVTNGFSINKAIARKLLTMGLFNINVSVDGLKPETHDFFRGFQGAGKRVFESIDILLNEKKKADSKTRIILKTIIARQNITEIIPLINWVKKKKLDGISFQPIAQTFGEDENVNWYKKSNLWPRKNELSKINKVLDEIVSLKKLGYQIYNPLSALQAFKAYFKNPSVVSRGECLVGSEDLTIFCNGEVILCGKFPVIGDLRIKDKDIKKIWYSKKADKVRKMIKNCRKKCLLTCYTKYSFLEKIKLFFQSSSPKLH